MRLNLGCGSRPAAGWVNIDRSPGILLHRMPRTRRVLRASGLLSEHHMTTWPAGIVRLDITKGLPFRDVSVQAIYSSHTLEHLYMNDAQILLRESFRVLQPGGVIRVALPDVEAMLRNFIRSAEQRDPDAGYRLNADLNTYPNRRPNLAGKLQALVSGQWHRWQPTRDLIFQFLADAGFSDASEETFREGALPDLEAVEHRQESFFIEASRSA